MQQRWNFEAISGLVMLCLGAAGCADVVVGGGGTGSGTSSANGGTGTGSGTSSASGGTGTGSGTSSASGGTGTGGGTSSASGGGGTGSGTSSASGGQGGMSTCAAYCQDIMANCTGDSAQYPDEVSCLAVCASFPAGKLGDMAGDSLECRAYHAGLPSKMAPAVHCAHSGPTGGDLDPTATGPGHDGPCGDGVEAFCALALETCTGASQVWADIAACRADVAKLPAGSIPFSTNEVTGNTFNCRVYHLTVAVENPLVHCAHIRLESPTCK